MHPLDHADLAQLCGKAYTKLTGVARDLEFFIAHVDDISYIAIRGTERCLKDIKRNLRIIPRHTSATGLGHGGFVRGAVAVAEALKTEGLQDRIVLTGHSLGGAIAVLVSQILYEQGHDIDECVIFGTPKIYLPCRPSFDYPVTSYRNGKDIVTSIPRPYRQAVSLTRLNNRFFGIPNWAEHSIERYELALRAGDIQKD